MEFFIGRTLGNAILNLALRDPVQECLHNMGLNLEDLEDCEPDAALGNGGLGRLAACFMDSMANLGIAATGYGIRYDYGIFEQKLNNGWQYEEADDWLCFGNPWERVRQEFSFPVNFYGKVEVYGDRRTWTNTEVIYAVPYDTPIPGYMCNVCCTLRLWGCKAPKNFDLATFNTGGYIEAVLQRNLAENIARVLYPNDNTLEGKELRLKQEYLLVSAACQDILRRYQMVDEHGPRRKDFSQLPEKVAIQLNDTHPSMGIPEMMRLLVDIEGVGWDQAWGIVQKTFSYTNHTVLPEAMERWSVDLIGRMLPRHLEIVFKINQDFCDMLRRKYPNDSERVYRMSIFNDEGSKNLKTANLCIVGSHSINGVAALHTEILKNSVFKDFYELWPEKFSNKTNGVTPRRWLKLCNPGLSDLLTEKLGEEWVVDFDRIQGMKKYADDDSVLEALMKIKHQNKLKLANYLFHILNVEVNPNTMFDIQVKRIHEYKRQLLNALHVVAMYNRIRRDPQIEMVPRTVMIGGKAAPGYPRAKLIINFINCIARKINNDSTASSKLKVVFLPNYRVTFAQYIIPGADLSQQISTAGMEASGTGNMKFMMNGALTIGTLDGANVEMAEEAGRENMFIFGHTVNELDDLKCNGYNPTSFIANSPELRECLDQIKNGFFCPEEPERFKELYDELTGRDYYMLCADFTKYLIAQAAVEDTYKASNQKKWARMCLLNIASSAKFSSDRTIASYAREIWNVPCDRLILPPPIFDPNAGEGSAFRRPSRSSIDNRFHAVNNAYD
uniref:Alpha-1,4 glucan phosphorylase n=1 Tax=Echinococcus granulosus TaxID=6210 RepID=A0A068WNS2_ECHGR|nr:Glycosyl transferase family 35 [Echinococcus granulosus]